MTRTPLLTSDLPGYTVRRGKVRDVYDLGDKLLLVSTDRISAFDWILPSGIPDKGQVLTQLSAWWFERSGTEHQVLSTRFADFGLPAEFENQLAGRSTLVRKTTVVPIECVVRGYLAGSGWKEYRQSQTVCGIKLPAGLRDGDRLPEPIFTPATKAESGHDENIPYEQMVEYVGAETASELRTRSLDLYRRGAELAWVAGLSSPTRNSNGGAPPKGRSSSSTKYSHPIARDSGPPTIIAPGRINPRLTSSSSATGWSNRVGIKTVHRQNFQLT